MNARLNIDEASTPPAKKCVSSDRGSVKHEAQIVRRADRFLARQIHNVCRMGRWVRGRLLWDSRRNLCRAGARTLSPPSGPPVCRSVCHSGTVRSFLCATCAIRRFVRWSSTVLWCCLDTSPLGLWAAWPVLGARLLEPSAIAEPVRVRRQQGRALSGRFHLT
jgi:hypothetical protein